MRAEDIHAQVFGLVEHTSEIATFRMLSCTQIGLTSSVCQALSLDLTTACSDEYVDPIVSLSMIHVSIPFSHLVIVLIIITMVSVCLACLALAQAAIDSLAGEVGI